MDALSAPDRLIMEAARSVREDFLHQLAFHDVDTYTSLKKQHRMMQLVIAYYDKASEALKAGADIETLVNLPVRERIGRFKYTKEDLVEGEYKRILSQLDEELDQSLVKEEEY